MTLYINGQDIRRLALALWRGEEWDLEVLDIAPEEYLKAIDTFLKKRGVEKSEIEKIICVEGPGSATSLRTALAIVNTWKFVQKVALVGVEKEVEMDDEEFLNTKVEHGVEVGDQEKYLEPKYMYSPRITPRVKDQLNRTAS